MSEGNRAVVRRLIEEVWNSWNIDATDELRTRSRSALE
jgi:hypothetical protein